MQHSNRSILYSILLTALLLTGMWENGYSQNEDILQAYQLGPGDLLKIDVFGEDDLTMEVMLVDTGIINYPFLGELNVAGLTIREFEQMLIGGLKGPYLVDPDITVSVIQYRNVYVTGEVESPGGYPYQPGLTVEKAIALAGGFTDRAATSKIDVKRTGTPGNNSSRVSMSYAIHPGDIITIHPSFF